VVTLKEVVTSRLADYNAGRGNVYLVFEYMDHDLHGLLSSNHQHAFTLPQVKCYMRQLLEGLHHLHKMKLIIHRDLKGSNLLVNNKGELKITDFGMSRFYNKNPELRDYTTRVVTVWFRAPELLFGDEKYGPAVDIWSAGCILAELLTRKPLFTGADELRVMDRITEVCGTPTNEVWPGVQQLKHYNILIGSNPLRPDQLDEELQRRKCDPIGAALLKKMLIFNPEKRIIAEDALHDDFFWKEPLPCTPKEMPIFPSAHEFEVRREKSAQQAARKKQRV
jgi:cyclin-dependent kinase 12/13